MDPLELLERASAGFERRLGAVAPAEWDLPSVCEGWSVRDVTDHVTGGNRFAVALLGGASVDDALVAARAGGFEGHPVELHRVSACAQLETFRAPDALGRAVHHPVGEITGAEFLAFRLGDLVLHGWDVARSTGGDDTIDDDLAEAILAVYAPMTAAGRDGGVFGAGPSGRVPASARPRAVLLDLSGRRP